VHVLEVWNAQHVPPPPPTQTSFGAQTVTQSTQYCGFARMLTHAPPQPLPPKPQVIVHMPMRQSGVLPVHACPAVPQFIGSTWRSTHAVPTSVKPGRQTHALFTHACRSAHAWPMVPQFSGSLVRSMHCPPDITRGAGQLHTPATQLEPPMQRWPQVPQFAASVCVSMQLPPHAVRPPPHAH
jgi:hypothetical protein